MSVEQSTKPLTGKELLNKLKEIPHLSRTQKARACGYVVSTKNNETRVSNSKFMAAILAAKGIELDPDAEEDGRGKKATYRVSVHQNGQIVIGSTYTKAMNLEPGSEFEIKLGYKHIHLNQIGEDGEES